MLWFDENAKCRRFLKGTEVQVIAISYPASKVCVGKKESCFTSWMDDSAFDSLKPLPRIFARGSFKVCWPGDIALADRDKDIDVPSGLVFKDWGRDDKETDILPAPDGARRNGTVVTTESKVLLRKNDCIVVTTKIIDDPDAKWDDPVAKLLLPEERRVFVSTALVSQSHGYEEIPLPWDAVALSGFATERFR